MTVVADTPRSAYRALELRATLTAAGLLLALAAAAWWSTWRRADEMDGMVQGIASVGTSMMTFDMSAIVFMFMWATMMVAMMFPTVMPIVLLHRMVTRKRGAGTASTVAFGAGYLIVWTIVGVLPLAVLIGFRHVSQDAGWIAPVSGVVLAVAGAYQFTAWKEICQRACRSPMTFLMTHDFGAGPLGAARTGVAHGLYCLGCCWALMAVLFVVGLMNLAWMAGIAVVFLAEKNWRHGPLLTKVAGGGLVALGIAVLTHSAVLTSVA